MCNFSTYCTDLNSFSKNAKLRGLQAAEKGLLIEENAIQVRSEILRTMLTVLQ